tara:strand:- start:358 stop:753 length:396 start_codon:yes stop_codon:yes gene_type:complete
LKINNFFAISLILLVFGANASETVYFFNEDKKITMSYVNSLGLRISNMELCQKYKCTAYLVASGEIELPKKIKWISGGANPTSTLCKKIEGIPRIAYLSNENEVSICQFSDNSFIFGWDLMEILKRNFKEK